MAASNGRKTASSNKKTTQIKKAQQRKLPAAGGEAVRQPGKALFFMKLD